MPDPLFSDVEITVNGEDVTATAAVMIERGVRAALVEEGAMQAEVSVTLLDDGGIQQMNATYLDRNHPTDVIAFSLGDPGGVFGDVYIGHQQAERQAAEHGEAIEVELLRLAIHGTLHVLGHDHPDGPERWDSPMFALQERLVAEVLGAA